MYIYTYILIFIFIHIFIYIRMYIHKELGKRGRGGHVIVRAPCRRGPKILLGTRAFTSKGAAVSGTHAPSPSTQWGSVYSKVAGYKRAELESGDIARRVAGYAFLHCPYKITRHRRPATVNFCNTCVMHSLLLNKGICLGVTCIQFSKTCIQFSKTCEICVFNFSYDMRVFCVCSYFSVQGAHESPCR